MQRSVKQIGSDLQRIHELRNERYFTAEGLYQFAKKNKQKYGLFERGDDLFVNTWNVDALISDYKMILDVVSHAKPMSLELATPSIVNESVHFSFEGKETRFNCRIPAIQLNGLIEKLKWVQKQFKKNGVDTGGGSSIPPPPHGFFDE